MNIADFIAGTYKNGYQYQYFCPNKINHAFYWTDETINQLLEQASLKLGELNSFSRFVPNIDMFIKMHILKEAVVSSRIEGASLADAVFIPPAHNELPELLNDLEFFFA